jgi:Na+-transporting methylmalonyl-CoA/oxaloacetate decarboxylase gamma subunit
VSLDRVTVITVVRESMAVFCSLGILIAAIYGFGKVLKTFEKD